MKALLLLALTIFTAVSTIATVAVVSNISTPNLFSVTSSIARTMGFRVIQPTGGDPVDDPVAPG